MQERQEEIPDRIQQHVKEVHKWLDDNVIVYKDVKTVTLCNFDMSWDKQSGYFQVKFDGHLCPMRFYMSLTSNPDGTVFIQRPMFISPLGAPASYAAIDIPEAATESIRKAVNSIFPKIKPLGLDRPTNTEITTQTKFEDRVKDMKAYESAKRALSIPGFQVEMAVN